MDQWQEQINALKTRYYQLSVRDRLALHGLVGLLVIVLLLVAVWSPLYHWSEAEKDSYVANKALVDWITANQHQVQGGGNRNNPSLAGRSILSVVTSTSAQNNISLKRYEPKSDGGVRVWLESVEFNAMIAWLNQLKAKYGVTVNSISIDRENEPGIVRATIVLN